MDLAQAIDLAAAPAKGGPRPPLTVQPPLLQGQTPLQGFTLAVDLPDSATPGSLPAAKAETVSPEAGGKLDDELDDALTEALEATLAAPIDSGAPEQPADTAAETAGQIAEDMAVSQAALPVLPVMAARAGQDQRGPQPSRPESRATTAPTAPDLPLAAPRLKATDDHRAVPAAARAVTDATHNDDGPVPDPRRMLHDPAPGMAPNAGQPAAPMAVPGARPDTALLPDAKAPLAAREDIAPLAPQALPAERGAASMPISAAPHSQLASRAQHVAGQVAAAISGADGRQIELRLDPPELGRLLMQLHMKDGEVSAIITVERGETLDLMRRHADVLARELARAGLGGADLSFRAQSDQQRGDGNRAASAEVRLHAPTGLADATAASPGLAPLRGLTADGSLDIRL